MEKMNPGYLLVLPILILLLNSSHALGCDEFSVSFMVDEENLWLGQSNEEIYKRGPLTTFKVPGTGQTAGLALKDLVTPFQKKSALIIYECDGGNESFEVASLLEGNAEKTDYFLVLSKRKFFKLLKSGSRKPLLKKIYQLKLLP